MFLNIRSNRFLSRSLAMASVIAVAASFASVSQAQMATGSGCTNCGNSRSAVTYSSPATTQYSQPQYGQAQYSQPVTQASYPVTTTMRQTYPRSHSGCVGARRGCSSSGRSVAHYRQANRSCGSTYSRGTVYSGSGCCGSSGYTTTGASYPVSSMGSTMAPYSAPVMQTGAGCAGGGCR